MSTRLSLRDSVAGALLALALAGLAGTSRAEIALWQAFRSDHRTENRDVRPVAAPASMERMVMRADGQDHVRAQIERMEARARADDRLSGRANDSSTARDDRGQRPDRNAQSAGRTDGRATGVGPGWPARDRDNTR